MAAHQAEHTRWVTSSVGIHLTSDRIVRVTGEDAISWLNGQVTSDVRALVPGRAVYALATTVKGRVLSDLWAVQASDGTAIVLPSTCADAALASFDKHIIMEDVELVADLATRVVTVQGPKAAQLLDAWGSDAERYACPRLPVGEGFDVWLPSAQLDEQLARLTALATELGGGALDQAAWSAAHVLLGVPQAGVDFGDDTYPQEAGLKARAVSFSKGCYLGQEVVYMLENRGQLSRRLVQLEGVPEQAAVGELVVDAENKRVGEITSLARDPAGTVVGLAYVKRAHADVGSEIRVGQSVCRVRCIVGAADAGCPIVASH